jgi:hypothetical protein
MLHYLHEQQIYRHIHSQDERCPRKCERTLISFYASGDISLKDLWFQDAPLSLLFISNHFQYLFPCIIFEYINYIN